MNVQCLVFSSIIFSVIQNGISTSKKGFYGISPYVPILVCLTMAYTNQILIQYTQSVRMMVCYKSMNENLKIPPLACKGRRKRQKQINKQQSIIAAESKHLSTLIIQPTGYGCSYNIAKIAFSYQLFQIDCKKMQSQGCKVYIT